MKNFYTPKDLIEILKLSKNTIYKHLETGKIKSTRLGKGKYRVSREEVEALLGYDPSRPKNDSGVADLNPKSSEPTAASSSQNSKSQSSTQVEALLGYDLDQPKNDSGVIKSSSKSSESTVASSSQNSKSQSSTQVDLDGGNSGFEQATPSIFNKGEELLKKLEIKESYFPNLFDWFIGVMSVLIGLSYFLFPSYFYHAYFSKFLTSFIFINTSLIVVGFLSVFSEIFFQNGNRKWHFYLHLSLVAVFSYLTSVFWLVSQESGRYDELFLYGSISIVLIIAIVFHKVSPIIKFIVLSLMVSITSALILVFFPDNYQFIPLPITQIQTIGFIWSGIALTTFTLSLISIKKNNKWFVALSSINGLIYLFYALVLTTTGNWDLVIAFLFFGVFSFLFPFWNKFRILHGKLKLTQTIYVLVIVIFIFAIGLMIANATQRLHRKSIIKNLEQELNNTSNQLHDYLYIAKNDLEVFSKSKPIRQSFIDQDWELSQDLAKDLFRSSEKYSRVSIVDVDGVFHTYYPHGNQESELVGDNFSYREYFKQAKSGNLYVSDLFQAPSARKPWLVMLSAPIYDFEGNFIGVIATSLDLLALQEKFSEIQIGSNGTAIVVDRVGRAIVHPDSSRLFKYSNDDIVRKLMSGESGNLKHYSLDFNGNDLELANSVFKSIDEFGWGVILEQSVNESNSTINGLILLILLSTTVSISIGMWFLLSGFKNINLKNVS